VKWLVRILVLAILAVQGYSVWNLARFEKNRQRGIRAYKRGEVAEVRDWFAGARAIDDADPLTWAWSGDAALYVYDWHAEGEIDPELGRTLLEEAWLSYSGAVSRCPSYAWSWVGLAGVAYRMDGLSRREQGLDLGVYDRSTRGIWDPYLAMALVSGSIAVEMKPSDYNALDTLAEVYLSVGLLEQAGDLLERSAKMMPAPSFHAWGSGEAFPRPLYDRIRDALENGIEGAPEFEKSMLYVEMGRFARNQSDPRRALVFFENAERYARNDYEMFRALRGKATVLETLGSFEEAAEALRRLLATGYEPRATNTLLGSIYIRLGDHKSACSSLAKALIEDHSDRGVRMQAVSSCEQAGELILAEQMLKSAFLSPVEDPVLARALLEFYRRQDRLFTASFLAEKWMRDFPGHERFREWAAEFQPEDTNFPER
jgi:tetratricopeptide (TPR) repeat protein